MTADQGITSPLSLRENGIYALPGAFFGESYCLFVLSHTCQLLCDKSMQRPAAKHS